MTRAFSGNLRRRVLAASRHGMSARSAAARFGIGISTVIAWIASSRQGQMTPAEQGRRGGSWLDAHEDYIFGMIQEAEDVMLNEMVPRMAEQTAVSIGRSGLDVWLRNRGWTFKKRPHMHWSRNAPLLLKRRQDWFDVQLDLDPARLVSIDETDLSTKMSRLRGRAICGERCRSPIPHAFLAYVEQILIPTLAPGDIVIMETCLRIKPKAFTGQLKRRDADCFTSRRTAQTLLRSKRRLLN